MGSKGRVMPVYVRSVQCVSGALAAGNVLRQLSGEARWTA
jgi:hypothetical protein